MTTYGKRIEGLEIIPSGGGCFEVKSGDEVIFSKIAEGRFPEHPEVLKEVEKRLP